MVRSGGDGSAPPRSAAIGQVLGRAVRHYVRMGDAKALVAIAQSWKSSGRSIRESFEAAAPDLEDPDALRRTVLAALLAEPELVDAWQVYSYNTRSSPSPYLEGVEVSYFDSGRTSVVIHNNPASACADHDRGQLRLADLARVPLRRCRSRRIAGQGL
jgi:hypothetical protein